MERMTVAQLRKHNRPRRDIEGPIHKEILAHLKARLPGAVIHHSPNELAMRGEGAARILALDTPDPASNDQSIL